MAGSAGGPISQLLRPDVIPIAATAGQGTLRPPTLLMAWRGVPAIPAVPGLLASVPPMSGFLKLSAGGAERWARSCGMTSVGESARAQPQTEPLPSIRSICDATSPEGELLVG